MSRLGWLALTWSLAVSSYFAFAPFGNSQEFVEAALPGDEGWELLIAHPSLVDQEGPAVLIVLGIPVLICLIALVGARVTRSELPLGVASVVLWMGCILGMATIGLFFLPAAALLAFTAGRTPRAISAAAPAPGR